MKLANIIATGLLLFTALTITSTSFSATDSRQGRDTIRPAARLETTPVPHRDDAADDPAIWIHPVSPEQSLILGTDKQGALHIYNMDGSWREAIGRDTQPNNVDVLYGFKLAGKTVDLAIATTRSTTSRGMKVWSIDPDTREFSDATAGETLAVLGSEEPYGCCTYQSPRTGKSYVFVTSKEGVVEQYELMADGGRVNARKVDALKFDSTVEACVADDEFGIVYLGEEKRGVWKYPAEPARGRRGEVIAKAGQNGLAADVEGLTIYYAQDGRGYLIVSSQGNNTFKIYERSGKNRFIQTISPKAGKFGDVQDTDGIAVTSQPTSPIFSKGLFVAQDGSNHPTQNFKLFAWEDIAGTNLIIDTSWSPRRQAAVERP